MADRTQTAPETYRGHTHQTVWNERLVAGGAGTEALAGLAAVVLTILALTDILSQTMTAIAAIVLGGGLLVEASAVAARWRSLHQMTGGGRDEAMLGGGMSAEMIAGAGGVALGVLALIGIVPDTLLAVASIALGAALVLGSGTQQSLSPMGWDSSPVPQQVAQAGAGGELLVGLAGVTLGVLALVLAMPMLTTIGLLTVGAGMFLGGSTLFARIGTAMNR
ncbi:MAG: hypothetical protein GC157_04100 [Frankiales bacterium]|nr:hypothetical protein [Frankiales bacterium]